MSEINEIYINQLREFEYQFRDGMVFTEDQRQQIIYVCEQIIEIAMD